MATNVDAQEIAKFDAVARAWWDPEGDFKPLHMLNPVRASYVEQQLQGVAGKQWLDVACGGGLFAEAMAVRGAKVTGIDMSQVAIDVAQQHASTQELPIEYKHCAIEDLSEQFNHHFDAVSCLEMLEHVPSPEQIVQQCARLVKPGGDVIFSTINRTPKAFLLAIVGAEYVAKMVPRGTHEYRKFIKPSELLRWASAAQLTLVGQQGLVYHPIGKHFQLTEDVSTNYFMHFKRDPV